MPIKKLSGRQEVIAATADFKFSDVVSGAYAPAVELPGGAIVVGGHHRRLQLRDGRQVLHR